MQGIKSNLKRPQIQGGLERKMVQMGRDFQQFQLDIATKGCKQMVGLSTDGLGG